VPRIVDACARRRSAADRKEARSVRADRSNWLIFAALGFMWGSSYLFIKIAVEDFGTFTLVALRLAIGAALLWIVLRMSRQGLPRGPRTYVHLLVMSVVNIALPFVLITWAERSVDSALAAILTSFVPLFAAVIAPLVLPDEPLRVNGIIGVLVGFVGVVVLTYRDSGSAGSDLLSVAALVLSSLSYAVGAVYSRRNVQGLHPMVPAAFQVTFALFITGVFAVVLERPWQARPNPAAVGAILWLGIFGSGLAYLAVFRLLSRWGATRTTTVAYVIPMVGVVLGSLVLGEAIDGRLVIGTALVIAGIAAVNAHFGRRAVFTRAASRPRLRSL
jgi:drug/metabolite transporter (DMT)-like permease